MYGNNFNVKFYHMWKTNRNKNNNVQELRNKIKDLELIELKCFSAAILNLFNGCWAFKYNAILRNDHKITEEELKNYIEKVC